MKIRFYLILLILVFSVQMHASGQNPDIRNIVNRVSGDSIFKHIEVLQEFDRQTLKNYRQCTDYVYNCLCNSDFDTIYFQEMEFEWTIFNKDSLYTSLPNIIAIKYGKSNPDSILVLGAHYDAPWILDDLEGIHTLAEIPTSPGADDNASGTSGVLEITRVLSSYQPERTIMVILFAAEEIGVAGSEYFLDHFRDRSKIFGMINLDMIAYSEGTDDPVAVIETNNNSMNIFNCCTESIAQYVPELHYVNHTDAAGDYVNFWEYNIPAISFIDGSPGSDNFNLYIHSLANTIGTSAVDTMLAELITKTIAATVMELNTKGTATLNEETELKNTEFILYPNPSKNYVHVEIEDLYSGNARIEILNIYGKVIQILISSSKESIIDMSDYSNGVYFTRMGNRVIKLIKM